MPIDPPPPPRLPGDAPAVVQIEALHFAWPGAPEHRPRLAGWSARIGPGVTWLGGDEGTGKTTLLKLLAGDLRASSGRLSMGALVQADAPAAWRQRVFRTDPRADADDHLTPRAFFAARTAPHPHFDALALDELVDGFALAPHLDKRLSMLSTGTRRKVWLAAALASGATLTLLDEPFAALDRASIVVLLDWLRQAAAHPTRAWVVADYRAPPHVPLAGVIDLDASPDQNVDSGS